MIAIPVQLVEVSIPAADGKGPARRGQCATCTRCAATVTVPYAPRVRGVGPVTEVKLGKESALADSRECCALRLPGGVAPVHVEHLVPAGLALLVRHPADQSLHPCTRSAQCGVQWRHGAVGDGAALVIAPAAGCGHAAELFAGELKADGYHNVTIAPEPKS